MDEGNEGWEEQETGFTKEHRDICGYAYVHYSDFGDSFLGVYTCQLTKDWLYKSEYILSMCNLLYVNYISIKKNNIITMVCPVR